MVSSRTVLAFWKGIGSQVEVGLGRDQEDEGFWLNLATRRGSVPVVCCFVPYNTTVSHATQALFIMYYTNLT